MKTIDDEMFIEELNSVFESGKLASIAINDPSFDSKKLIADKLKLDHELAVLDINTEFGVGMKKFYIGKFALKVLEYSIDPECHAHVDEILLKKYCTLIHTYKDDFNKHLDALDKQK